MSTVLVDLDDILREGHVTLAAPRMTPQQFYAFSRKNPNLNAERNADGTVEIRAPSDSFGESRVSELTGDLIIWNRQQAVPGLVFGSSAGFELPNGAIRAPDASYVSRARWEALSADERSGFAKICPEFVVEVLSPSDSLAETQRKMEEYLANGALLGWLFDRKGRRVFVYRPGQAVREVTAPETLSGDPELPGLIVDARRVLEPDQGRP